MRLSHPAANGASGIVFAAVERFGRDRGCSRHANQDIVAGWALSSARERIAQQEFISVRGLYGALVEPPEALIDGVERHSRCAPARSSCVTTASSAISGHSGSSCSRKDVLDVTAYWVAPSRASARSRRLARTDSPTL